MFILVLVVLMATPEGDFKHVRTEYRFYHKSDCIRMVQTLTKVSIKPFKYRCEQVT